MSDDLLQLKDLSVTYKGESGDVKAVKNLNLTLKKGEALGIVGESGSGKSTIALAIMRLLHERHVKISGEVNFMDQDLLKLSGRKMRQIRGRDIGMIFQDPMTSLNPYLKIGLQVVESLMIHEGKPFRACKERAIELLDSVDIQNPQDQIYRNPHEFSGGMRQRAMIASALACSPKLLIADEPTTALDVITQAQVLDLMKKKLAEDPERALILITHDLGIVAEVCDRVAVMLDGELVECNDVFSLFANPENEYTKNLLAAVPRIDEKKSQRFRSISGTKEGDKKTVKKESAKKAGEIIFSTEDLNVRFSSSKGFFGQHKHEVHAVKDVSLDLHEGEVLGLVGQSGSGKSTFIRAALQLNPADSGRVLYQGRDLCKASQRELRQSRKDLQLIFQDPYASLNSRMNIQQIIAAPLLNYGIMNRKKAYEKVKELMSQVKLDPDWARRFPHEFSGGQRQRIGIARALALQPKIIFCDEPVSALDVSVQAEIMNLLKELQEDYDLTMLFISHDLSVVRHFADRVAVMHRGEIVECLDADNIYKDAQHPYTQSLIDAIPIPDPGARK